uniref:Uncharacterized protein n=1 Tax=Picea glauca TaxID=3330 RepID=A0A101M2P2_PICGL|nr:hypothetical protein ABT39_MTgene3036 [Picea glauca]QHR91947.1 hypothetical protein Q903MT_gene5983 [Picea sitchensis]
MRCIILPPKNHCEPRICPTLLQYVRAQSRICCVLALLGFYVNQIPIQNEILYFLSELISNLTSTLFPPEPGLD